jgi:hypothetical protein
VGISFQLTIITRLQREHLISTPSLVSRAASLPQLQRRSHGSVPLVFGDLSLVGRPVLIANPPYGSPRLPP